MKRKITFLLSALFALTLITQSFSAMGQTYVYTLVKSIDDLAEGDVILITSGTDGDVKALGTYNSGNNVPATDVSIDEETIEDLADAHEITLETQSEETGEENYFTLKYGTNQYLYAANTQSTENKKKNLLKVKNDDAIYWSIVINTTTYVATIVDETSTSYGRNNLRYNSSSTLFSCYASGNQGDVYIFKKVESGGDGEDNDLALTDAPISLSFDLYNDSDAKEISYTTSSSGAVSVDANSYISAEVDQVNSTITVTPVKKTPTAQTITVRQAADETYKAGSVTFTVTITDSNPVEWVETDLADLTSGDVFVIVCDNGSYYYAMSNDKGTSSGPTASTVTIDNGKIDTDETDVTDNILWNIVITDDGYIFYPAGTNDKWLYCTNTNDGVRVGTNADNNVFSIGTDDYIKNNATSRYIGVYTGGPNWRCYSTTEPNSHSNIGSQTFAFYKKVYENTSTYYKDIEGCGEGTTNHAGYYLIASPVISVTPDPDGDCFITSNYDLYRFNQSGENGEWENYKAHDEFTSLISGAGYLYASQEYTKLEFTGQPYNGNGLVGLIYNEGAPNFVGLNLIGNPLSTAANIDINKTSDYYRINDDGDDVTPGEGPIAKMEGVFVFATAVNQTAKFTVAAGKGTNRLDNSQIVLNVVGNNDNLIDRAIVRFNESDLLPKFMLDESNTKIYIPQDDSRYAIVQSEGNGTMPVNFKAKGIGKYTIRVNTEGIDMDYLHLIDRLTGEDINLLLDNSYSFIASAQDVESRFILSFTATGYNQDADEPFAFQNGSDIIVNGTGELQIFDLMGRMVSTQNVNGIETINVKSQGVYIFRLNEKTQKIVVR